MTIFREFKQELSLKKLSINTLDKLFLNICLILLLLVAIFLPDGIKKAICIYKMDTANLPINNLYYYYFTIADLLIVLIGIVLFRKTKVVNFYLVSFLIFVINCVYSINNPENIFSLKGFETLLMALEGVSICSIIFYLIKDEKNLFVFFNTFILFLFLTQILMLLIGRSSSEGRVGSLAIGSGATAQLYFVYLLWYVFSAKGKRSLFFPLFASVGMVLTGSRTNILMLGLSLVAFIFPLLRKAKEDGMLSKLIKVFIIGAVGVIVLFALSDTNEMINRVVSLFKDNDLIDNITSDSSYLGRIKSINAGFEILKNHPHGIACSIYDIEYKTCEICGMEYPHSTLQCYFLMFSPMIMTLILIFVLYYVVRLFLIKDRTWVVLVILILHSIFYGSPILHTSDFMLYFIIYSIAKYRVASFKMQRGVIVK